MSILQTIIEQKKKEVMAIKAEKPLESFINTLKKSERDFKGAIEGKVETSIIAEIKKKSPSQGVLRGDFNVFEIAKIYERHAQAISALTDEEFFGGKLEYIEQVKSVTTIPVLRKDFIIDEYQVYESRGAGADAILLIASILSSAEIQKFARVAKEYNMDALVEVHTKQELEKVLEAKAEIIGINNRNLQTFEVDIQTTLDLLRDGFGASPCRSRATGSPEPKQPGSSCKLESSRRGKVIVSESGFKTREDIEKVKGKADAVLIGTSFMKAKDIEGKIKEILGV